MHLCRLMLMFISMFSDFFFLNAFPHFSFCYCSKKQQRLSLLFATTNKYLIAIWIKKGGLRLLYSTVSDSLACNLSAIKDVGESEYWCPLPRTVCQYKQSNYETLFVNMHTIFYDVSLKGPSQGKSLMYICICYCTVRLYTNRNTVQPHSSPNVLACIA